MNKYTNIFICLFFTVLIFACNADETESSGMVTDAKVEDVYATNDPKEMSQEMKNMDSKERLALNQIAELQKQAVARNRNKQQVRKSKPNEVTYIIGSYEDSSTAGQVVEAIYRIEYKIKPVIEQVPNGLQILATCRFKDQEELAKMEAALKAKFGEEISRVDS